MRSTNPFELLEEPNQRNSLNRLAQPHLISQDTVDARLVQRYQPIQSRELVILQLPSLQDGGLLVQPRWRV